MSVSGEKSVAFSQRKHFDRLRSSSHVTVRPIRPAEIPDVARFASDHLPSLPLEDLGMVERIVAFDPDMIQVFEVNARLAGLFAMLFLNQAGLDALLTGRFDGAQPCFDHLATKNCKPAAIYTWFIACPGRAASGIGNVSEFLQGARYAEADLYARPASAGGLRIMRATGHRPMTSDTNGLHRYVRLSNCRQRYEQAA